MKCLKAFFGNIELFVYSWDALKCHSQEFYYQMVTGEFNGPYDCLKSLVVLLPTYPHFPPVY